MSRMRHIGQTLSTGSRVIIVTSQIPGRADRALVLQPETLPDSLRSTLNSLVQTPEGQSSLDFGQFLDRRKVEGYDMSLLMLLHKEGRLVPMPIDNIVLTPSAGEAFPMREILERTGHHVPKVSDSEPPVERRFNPHEHNQQADLEKNRLAIAKNLLAQAAILDEEAALKREEAYKACPDLRPLPPVSTIAAPTPEVAPIVSAPETAADGGFELNMFGGDTTLTDQPTGPATDQ